MKISIRKPIGYSQIGRKDQQEDAVWPLFPEVSANNPCIVLCDGVGGSEHGEIASQTSSRVIGEYLTKLLKDNHAVSEADVHEAVNLAYDELEKIDTESSEEGIVTMATTLTCICIHNDGILAAHMGDSRIYHIRPGQGLLYQSADHSLVNALLQAGEITVEEAKDFPRKNVITKAIQPHGKKRFKAEVQHLTDIQSGDYIFLCCDGVLEQLTNERLVEILSMKCSDNEKISLLEAESTGKTKDNYTAYLIPIDKVKGVSSMEQEEEIATVVVKAPTTVSHKKDKAQSSLQSQTNPTLNKLLERCNTRYIIAAVLAVVFLFLGFLLGRCSSDEKAPEPKEESKLLLNISNEKKSDASAEEAESPSEERQKTSEYSETEQAESL